MALPLRRFLETSEPSLLLLRRLQVVDSQVGGSISMESGMRHRKVNQSTRDCLLSVSERAVSYRLSWLLLPCTAASSPLNVLGCVEGPRHTCHGRNNWAFTQYSGRDITMDAVHVRSTGWPLFGLRFRLQPFLPSASRAAWRIRAPHHLLFTDGDMSVPCSPRSRCETGPGPCLGTVRTRRVLVAEISPPARSK